MIHVNYTDGERQSFNTLAEAEEGVSEAVLGCDFAVTVESIEDDDGREIRVVYSLKLEEQNDEAA